MENELWLKRIKERLEQHSEPLPPAGWEQLEKELSGSALLPVRKKRMLFMRRYAVTAAAAVLAAVSAISLWLLQSPVAEEIRQTTPPALAAEPDALIPTTLPTIPTPEVASGRNRLVQYRSEPVKEIKTTVSVPVEHATTEEKQPTTSDETSRKEAESDKQDKPSRQPSTRKKIEFTPQKRKSESGKWAVALAIGNAGSISSDNALRENNAGSNQLDYIGNGGKIDLSTTANEVLNIPDNQEVVFMGGMPYLKSRYRKITSIDHKQPVSVGVSVRKGLHKGFSVETGVTYTYLASEIQFDTNEEISQKLHYIGIPLRANWNFVEQKTFILYVSAGGAVEKCVYGKAGTEKITVNPLQFSVSGAIGAQANLSKHMGFYVEPGVSYFFDDGSPIQTIRKENPCNFSLQAGIRLTY